METPVETLLVVMHVSAGFIVPIVAPVAMLTRKGSGAHKRWGRVYFWAMVAVFVTALLLLAFRPNVFLFFISVLSFYGAFSGVRSLGRKNLAKGQGPNGSTTRQGSGRRREAVSSSGVCCRSQRFL